MGSLKIFARGQINPHGFHVLDADWIGNESLGFIFPYSGSCPRENKQRLSEKSFKIVETYASPNRPHP